MTKDRFQEFCWRWQVAIICISAAFGTLATVVHYYRSPYDWVLTLLQLAVALCAMPYVRGRSLAERRALLRYTALIYPQRLNALQCRMWWRAQVLYVGQRSSEEAELWAKVHRQAGKTESTSATLRQAVRRFILNADDETIMNIIDEPH